MQFREKAQATLVLCVSVASALILLMGCQSRPVLPTPQPSTIARPPPVAAVDPSEIQALLDAAEAAMERQQWTYPAQDSALVLFDRVLVMDPGNLLAQRGLERIAEHYLELAEAALQRNQLAAAQAMLEWARLVDAGHPDLEPTARKIDLLTNARRERLALEPGKLRERSSDLSQPLQVLGGQAREPNCRATIRVRSDAEGRWVYQQMNRAPGDARIRAQIQIGSPPLVELLCFQEG